MSVFSVGIFAHSRHLYNSPSFYDILYTEKRALERLTSNLAWFSYTAVHLWHGHRYCLGYCSDMRTEVNGNIGHPSLYGLLCTFLFNNNNNTFISYIKYTNITLPANSKANRGRWCVDGLRFITIVEVKKDHIYNKIKRVSHGKKKNRKEK